MAESVKRGRPPRPAPPQVESLRRLAGRIERHDAANVALHAERERLVRDALAAGGAQRVVAQASGLSRQRVAQIAQRDR